MINEEFGIMSQVLVVDFDSTGKLVQPFESAHRYNVVICKHHIELREFEQLSDRVGKYTIHTEKFDSGSKMVICDERAFLGAFGRQFELDNTDIRKCIRMGLKASLSSQINSSVVV